jgi:hypothetical protein
MNPKKDINSLYLDDDGLSYQLKEASVRDASATPPTIGRRDITTQGVGNCKFHLSGAKHESRRILAHSVKQKMGLPRQGRWLKGEPKRKVP